jgi:hypothetical protein
MSEEKSGQDTEGQGFKFGVKPDDEPDDDKGWRPPAKPDDDTEGQKFKASSAMDPAGIVKQGATASDDDTEGQSLNAAGFANRDGFTSKDGFASQTGVTGDDDEDTEGHKA